MDIKTKKTNINVIISKIEDAVCGLGCGSIEEFEKIMLIIAGRIKTRYSKIKSIKRQKKGK